jgi:hypothetical protein
VRQFDFGFAVPNSIDCRCFQAVANRAPIDAGFAVPNTRSNTRSTRQATDLTNLPPAYISIGSLDLFLDEDMGFVNPN